MKTCNIAVLLVLHLVRFYMLISNIALTRLQDKGFVKTWNSNQEQCFSCYKTTRAGCVVCRSCITSGYM